MGDELEKDIRPIGSEDFENISGHCRPCIKPDDRIKVKRRALVEQASEMRNEHDDSSMIP